MNVNHRSTELYHIVENLEESLSTSKFQYNDDYYVQVLNNIVVDITMMPVHRDEDGLDPINDPESMELMFRQIVHVLAETFDKEYQDINNDLFTLIKSFPITDYRTASALRQQNRLH